MVDSKILVDFLGMVTLAGVSLECPTKLFLRWPLSLEMESNHDLKACKPAEAKFRFAGSEMAVRFHLRAERPPLRINRLDIPMIPLLGLPYLKKPKKIP